jgi:hypothetical protein
MNFEDFADTGKWILEDDPPLLTVEDREILQINNRLQIQTNKSESKKNSQ